MATVIHQTQPHGVVMPAAQTVQYHHQTGPLPGENLKVTQARITCWTQIICAALSVILGIVAISIDACKCYSATPIWCGLLFYLPAGIMGVVAASQKNSCLIIGCMVMSILAAIFSVIPFGVNLSGAVNENNNYYDDYYYNYNYYCPFSSSSDNYAGKVTVNSILTIVAVVEFIAAIYASVVMGGASNCCRTRPNTTVTVVSSQAVPNTTTQVIHTGYQPQPMPYGQQPAYPYQPPAGNYQPPAGNYPPPAGGYPAAGGYPPAYGGAPPNYTPTEGKM